MCPWELPMFCVKTVHTQFPLAIRFTLGLSLSLCRMLFGGLGQLCDGVLGGDDFVESKELRVWPGYDYVGWSREALGKPTVDIEFHFEKPRLFHTMQVSTCMRTGLKEKIWMRVGDRVHGRNYSVVNASFQKDNSLARFHFGLAQRCV